MVPEKAWLNNLCHSEQKRGFLKGPWEDIAQGYFPK